MYPVMANGIRTDDPRGFNKGHSSKFRVGSQVQQTPKECWRAYRLKRCGNNKDEDNSPKTLNDKRRLSGCYNIKEMSISQVLLTNKSICDQSYNIAVIYHT